MTATYDTSIAFSASFSVWRVIIKTYERLLLPIAYSLPRHKGRKEEMCQKLNLHLSHFSSSR